MKQLVLLVCSLGFVSGLQAEPAAKDALIVETILRMERFDLGSSEKAQAAVGRYLDETYGTSEYMGLIRHFTIRSRDAELLKLALEKPGDSVGVDAAKFLLEQQAGKLLLAAAGDPDEAKARAALKVLANSRRKEAAEIIPQVIRESKRPLAVRKAAVDALATVGEQQLLALAESKTLQAELQAQAISKLMASVNAKIREAATVLKGGKRKLAPTAELVKRTGNAAKGKVVYGRSCAACHLPSTLNIDYGPSLAEIGSKLPRVGLYDAIINPAAGVSFGFETWQFTLKDGGELMGILASETDDKIAIKLPGGIVQEYAKAKVAKRKQLKISLMPAGLEQTMSEQELVDLVEYLAGLKKP